MSETRNNFFFGQTTYIEKQFNYAAPEQPTAVAPEVCSEVVDVTDVPSLPIPVLPEELSSPRALQLWQRLQDAGKIDEKYMPVAKLSKTEVGVIAYWLTELLDIRSHRWSMLEQFWGVKYLAQSYNTSINQSNGQIVNDNIYNIICGRNTLL